MSQTHPSRTYALRDRAVSTLASSANTLSNSVNKNITSSTERAWKLWKAPLIGRWRSDKTSSSVIVNSPTERWKVLVSLCHLSTNADISLGSPVTTEHPINGLNHVASTSPSISGTDLPINITFLPWDTNFNLGRSWIEVQSIPNIQI